MSRPSLSSVPAIETVEPSNVQALAEHLAPLVAQHLTNGADALLDADGAARLLNVPASWVLAEARAERIPHVRLGRYVRFDREELTEWRRARPRGPRVRTGSRPVSNEERAA